MLFFAYEVVLTYVWLVIRLCLSAPQSGVSAGSLTAVLAACDVDLMARADGYVPRISASLISAALLTAAPAPWRRLAPLAASNGASRLALQRRLTSAR